QILTDRGRSSVPVLSFAPEDNEADDRPFARDHVLEHCYHSRTDRVGRIAEPTSMPQTSAAQAFRTTFSQLFRLCLKMS
ncbi:MAG: hypothetical protein JWN47_233, partial [Frankiales bacterium]|nr:hypothetical protein [Frankiales bacterium]